MDMEAMDTMATMARGLLRQILLLLLSQGMDMAMSDMAMEAMDTMATMARGLLRLSPATAMDRVMVMVMDMVGMAMEVMDTMATMARDLLMLSQAMVMGMAMDMAMDMEDMAMEDMDMVMGTMDKRERNIQFFSIAVHQEFSYLTQELINYVVS